MKTTTKPSFSHPERSRRVLLQIKPTKNVFLIFIILCIYGVMSNKVFAQGPNAPEAASFEPVDATDMVNLVTGNLSYVLPLLNVPSPEGGYPIALSYHAGVAMEQEASWVGLGWSLNPGTINRGVNGYPDDWGKTNINEFFYDAGWTDNYYSFSVGLSLSDAVSVGLGLSWGSNQSLGGYIFATIGIRNTQFGVGGSIGTNGFNASVGYKGFSTSIGTSGVGIDYGFSKEGSDTTLGIGLNYNYNSGLSGRLSVSKSGGHGFSSGQGYKPIIASLGVNWSSSGVSLNASANGAGVGVSLSNNGITSGDIHVDVASGGFSINALIFNISYSHQHVKYSLYKYNNLYTSGILNPIDANELRNYDDSPDLSRLLYENNFMDVNVFAKYEDSMEVNQLLDNLNQVDKNNLVLPNYDNYSVTAQGLSGNLKPYLHTELNLSGRGRGEQNADNLYAAYLNNNVAEYHSAPSSGINVNRDAVKKVNFTFDNVYNSFLRMDRSNIFTTVQLYSAHSDHIMNGVVTSETSNFDNYNSLTNAYEAKKREGNYIETFTNKEIRDSYNGGNISNISNFMDAKQYNNQSIEINLDRSNTEVFLNDGIGAYQITTTDGRTYHYSLPVYNYETFYKNFKNQTNEDENFFEIQKTSPYATHWLLTAITGPDYIDINTNGTADDGDYGYWVTFDYGKWSDGYAWQTPNGDYKVDEDASGDKTYSYAWGRKQVYYLDAIKTRTHTALFIKDLREDNKSITGLSYYNSYHSSGNFDFNQNPESISSGNQFKPFGKPGETFYDENGVPIILPSTGHNNNWIRDWIGRENFAKYVDIPEGYSLKLTKVILLKNENIVYNKNNGSLTSVLNGKFYNNKFITEANSTPHYAINATFYNQKLYASPNSITNFQTNLHDNVLDVKDIEGLDLEDLAQQVIELNHDYSLAKNSPNSDDVNQGRLTLKELSYKGKQGVQLVPPYKFSYFNINTSYNKNQIDEWGYNKYFPQLWSLNQIQTPTGGKIKMVYEADSYYAEAASYETKYFEDVTLAAAAIPGITIDITINNITNITDYFKAGRNIMLTFTRKTLTNTGQSGYQELNPIDYTTPLEVSSITGNTLHLLLVNETEGITYNDVVNMCVNSGSYCYRDLKIKNNQHPLYTDTDLNGKQGGGIRTKSITINNGVTDIAKSEYVYTNPETNKISGITSYAPSDDPKGIPYVSELPPPMVTYEHVRMINKDGDGTLLGSTAYKFGVLEPFHIETGYIYSLGETFKVKENQNQTFQSGSIMANKYTLHNCLGNIGRMISLKSYNFKDQLLSKKDYQYKTGLDSDGEIGVTQESHKSYKRILKDNVESFAVSSTSKINYPSVLESTTTTQGGFTNTTNFTKYDFLTGQVLETTTTDSKGNEFKTELIPAYTMADYNINGYGMGSKVDNTSNYNMLTQEAMTKTYLKVGNDWKESGVGITTWNNQWDYTNYDGNQTFNSAIPTDQKIWRKHKNYVWNGDLDTDGTYLNYDVNSSFDWTVGQNVPQTNTKWKNTSTTTQYDHYSMPLEVKDINNNYASTKMDKNHEKILSVSNAAYTEQFFSGAEEGNNVWVGGHINIWNYDASKAHTGLYSENAGVGSKNFKCNPKPVLHSGQSSKRFKISVWTNKETYNPATKQSTARIHINGSDKPFNGEIIEAGNWVQLNHYESLTAQTEVYVTASSGTVYFDDFRLYPASSSMTGYVYNNWDELWYIIGNNGLASKFEYDSAGRLKTTYTEVEDFNGVGTGGFKKVSQNSYNYKLQ